MVRSEHPANIGAVARVLCNVGLGRLTLVDCASPRLWEAYATGWKARHLLERARTCDTLKEALAGVHLAVGFTARAGRNRQVRLLDEVAGEIARVARRRRVALLFGNEKSGLTAGEAACCRILARIPTHRRCPSLNVSHAVAIAAYVIRRARLARQWTADFPKRDYSVTAGELERSLAALEEALVCLGYGGRRTHLRSRIVRAVRETARRGLLDRRSVRIIRALATRTEQRIRDATLSAPRI